MTMILKDWIKDRVFTKYINVLIESNSVLSILKYQYGNREIATTFITIPDDELSEYLNLKFSDKWTNYLDPDTLAYNEVKRKVITENRKELNKTDVINSETKSESAYNNDIMVISDKKDNNGNESVDKTRDNTITESVLEKTDLEVIKTIEENVAKDIINTICLQVY